MKHPEREEWVPYLFGETDPTTKKQLANHLNACPECARELNTWRKSLQRLDTWKPQPQPQRRRFSGVNPALNLAAAALLVLGLGLGLGHWFSASGEDKQRARLESSLRASLIPEVRRQMAGELQWKLAQQEQNFSEALARAKAEAISSATADASRNLQQLVTAMQTDRAEDRQAAAAWVEQLRKKHDTDYVSLRQDLETVAALTDEQIRAARLKLIELTAVTPLNENH